LSAQFRAFRRELSAYFDATADPSLTWAGFVGVVGKEFSDRIAPTVLERETTLKERLIELTDLKIGSMEEVLKKYRRNILIRKDIACGLFFISAIDSDFSLTYEVICRQAFGEHDGSSIGIEEAIGMVLRPSIPNSRTDPVKSSNRRPEIFSYRDYDGAAKLLPSPRPQTPFDGDKLDVFYALNWRSKLSRLHGRSEEISTSLKFVLSAPQGNSSFIFITGSGGSGKTRLAAEIETTLRETYGWQTGFLPRNYEYGDPIYVGDFGVAILLDYPEERTELTCKFIKYLMERHDFPVPVCFVLISREPFARWIDELNVPALRNSLEIDLSNPSRFNVQSAEKICGDVLKSLQTQKPGVNPPATQKIKSWLSEDPSHCAPLFATAASVHAYLEPDLGFSLSSRDVLIALAKIERTRVRSYSVRDLGNRELLERLLSFSLFTASGLQPSLIEKIRASGLFPGNMMGETSFNLRKSPFWDQDDMVLQKLEPDRAAAAFIELVFDWRNKLHLEREVLSIIISEEEGRFFPILDRIAQDLYFVSNENSSGLISMVAEVVSSPSFNALDIVPSFPVHVSRRIQPIKEQIYSRLDDVGEIFGGFGVGFLVSQLHSKFEQGKYSEIRSLANKIIERVTKLRYEQETGTRKISDHEPLWKRQVNLIGGLVAASGAYGKIEDDRLALKVAEDAVELAKTIEDTSHYRLRLAQATSYANYAGLLRHSGRGKEAQILIDQAIQIIDTVRQEDDTRTLEFKGRVYLEKAKTNLALEKNVSPKIYFEKALSSFSEANKKTNNAFHGEHLECLRFMTEILVKEENDSEFNSIVSQIRDVIVNAASINNTYSDDQLSWWIINGSYQLACRGEKQSALDALNVTKLVLDSLTPSTQWVSLFSRLRMAQVLWLLLLPERANVELNLVLKSIESLNAQVPTATANQVVRLLSEVLSTAQNTFDEIDIQDYISHFEEIILDMNKKYNGDLYEQVAFFYQNNQETAMLLGRKGDLLRLGVGLNEFYENLVKINFTKNQQQYCVALHNLALRLYKIEAFFEAKYYSDKALKEFQIVYDSNPMKFQRDLSGIKQLSDALRKRKSSSGSSNIIQFKPRKKGR